MNESVFIPDLKSLAKSCTHIVVVIDHRPDRTCALYLKYLINQRFSFHLCRWIWFLYVANDFQLNFALN